MDRETFKLGRAVLKTKIKALAAAQKRDKDILRMPRKTKEDWEAIKKALSAAGYSTKEYIPIGEAHGRCWFRRQEITAYLKIYADIRQKETGIHPGSEYYLPIYQKYLKEAQALFDQATKPVAVA